MYHIHGNLHQEKIICPSVNDCIEDMANFTALARINFTKCFCNTHEAELGGNFVQ